MKEEDEEISAMASSSVKSAPVEVAGYVAGTCSSEGGPNGETEQAAKWCKIDRQVAAAVRKGSTWLATWGC